MIDFLTKHFLVLSSLVVTGAAAYSMLFLSAYLGVFDWNLVWLIEYSDLAKLALIGIAIASGALALTINMIYLMYRWLALKETTSRFWVGCAVAVTVLGSAVTIFFDVKNGTGQWQFQVLSSFSSLILILIIGAIIRDLDALKAGEFGAIYRTVVLFAFSMGFFGATFGHYVKDVSKDFSEITSKNGTYDNAKVVMLLSHHVVFFSNGSVITIPTGDVVKITTSAKSTILMTH
jgi:hypothetical protein